MGGLSDQDRAHIEVSLLEHLRDNRRDDLRDVLREELRLEMPKLREALLERAREDGQHPAQCLMGWDEATVGNLKSLGQASPHLIEMAEGWKSIKSRAFGGVATAVGVFILSAFGMGILAWVRSVVETGVKAP